MSTPSTEVKAAVSQEAANLSGDAVKAASQVAAQLVADQAALRLRLSAFHSRLSALEVQAKTFYERHVPVFFGLAGVVIGYLIGRV